MRDVTSFNLKAMWVTSLILLVFIKRQDNLLKIRREIGSKKIAEYLYLSFSCGLIITHRDLILGNVIYGEGQSIDSAGSFDPLERVWNLRIYFLVYALAFGNISNRKLGFYLTIEALVGILLTERKELAFVVLFVIMLNLNKRRLRTNRIKFRQVGSYLSIMGIAILIPVYRSFAPGIGFLKKVSLSVEYLRETSGFFLYYVTGFVNSEGVQNWTLQLVNDGSLKSLYGLSYFQGLLNTFWLRPLQPEWLVKSQASYHFKAVAYPNTTNHGYDFSFTSEAILNFGTTYGLLSYLVLSIYIVFLYRGKSKILKFQRLLIFPVLLISFRTDSTAMFRMISYIYFVSLFMNLYKLGPVWWGRRRRRAI